MMKLALSGLLLVLMVSGCGWNGTPSRHNDFTPLTSITIVAVSSTIAAHTSTTLKVTGNYSGLFTRDITEQAVWSCAAPAVASFVTPSAPNRVTGLAPGSATLTATVGTVSNTFTLTVSSATVTAMTITPAAPTIPKGLTSQFTVSGTFSDATTQDLTFDASWTSSDAAVATVSDVAGSKGLAQAVSVGSATISAAFGGSSASSLMTVSEAVLQSIAVSPAAPTVLSLSSRSFQATGSYSDGSTADITARVAWSSSRSDIAAIASSGTATTLVQGTTSISATLNGVSGATSLTVTGGNLTGIRLTPALPRLIKGTAGRMTATGTFSNGTTRDVSGVVGWTVSDAAVVTVSLPGGNLVWLKALAATPAAVPATITATSGALTTTASLTVADPLLQTLAISPTSLELTAGASDRFTVTASYSDGTTQNVTASADWTSNDTTIASVGTVDLDRGRVSSLAAGSATISAQYGGLTVTAPVTARTRTLLGVTITGSASVLSGNQAAYTATAQYYDGTTKDVTENAVWSVDNGNVAVLADRQHQPGQVVAVAAGTATLTASFGGMTQTATITVP